MRIISCPIFLLLITFCKSTVTRDEIKPRIVGGYACDVREIPFLVAIFTRMMCGGSLVTLNWVLTAAHCIKPEVLNGVMEIATVRAGFNSPVELIQIRKFKEIFLHENFRPKMLKSATEMRFDIGLIELDEPFEYSSVAQPAQLPTKGFTSRCKIALAAGVGLTSANEMISSTLAKLYQRPVMCVELQIIHNVTYCQKAYPQSQKFDNSVFCTSQDGKDSCSGDSGGPIICGGVIIGIVSFGPVECGTPFGIATYTKVEEYLGFIRQHVFLMESRSANVKNSQNDTPNDARKPIFSKKVFFMCLALVLILQLAFLTLQGIN